MKNEITIFYTDDDQDDQEFFREIVNDLEDNFVVVTQSSGKQLLHALDNPPPTPYLIFLDINMPGMSGFEVLKLVRKSEKHRLLPVVMFSTSNDTSIIEKSRELGASFYLPKSSMFEQLKKSIEHTLKINWGSFIPGRNNFVYNISQSNGQYAY